MLNLAMRTAIPCPQASEVISASSATEVRQWVSSAMEQSASANIHASETDTVDPTTSASGSLQQLTPFMMEQETSTVTQSETQDQALARMIEKGLAVLRDWHAQSHKANLALYPSPTFSTQYRTPVSTCNTFHTNDAMYIASENTGRISISFHRFPDLPIEVRRMIWAINATTNPRVVEVKATVGQEQRIQNEKFQGYHFPIQFTSFTLVPSILHVSQEARAVGLRFYSALTFEDQKDLGTYINWDVDYLWFRRNSTGHSALTKFINNIDKRLKWSSDDQIDVNIKCKNLVLEKNQLKETFSKSKAKYFPQVEDIAVIHSLSEIWGPLSQSGVLSLRALDTEEAQAPSEIQKDAKMLFKLRSHNIHKVELVNAWRGEERALTAKEKVNLMKKMPEYSKKPETLKKKLDFRSWKLTNLETEAKARGLISDESKLFKKTLQKKLLDDEKAKYAKKEKAYAKALAEHERTSKEYFRVKNAPGFYSNLLCEKSEKEFEEVSEEGLESQLEKVSEES